MLLHKRFLLDQIHIRPNNIFLRRMKIPFYARILHLLLALLRVPVLSKAIISHFARVSSTFASLKTIDRFVEVPIATKVAIGVARLSAQGQAITNTLIATPKASCPPH